MAYHLRLCHCLLINPVIERLYMINPNQTDYVVLAIYRLTNCLELRCPKTKERFYIRLEANQSVSRYHVGAVFKGPAISKPFNINLT